MIESWSGGIQRFLQLGAVVGAAVLFVQCGVSHTVNGKVEVRGKVRLEISEIVAKVETACDKEIDGKPVFNTVESYKECVYKILRGFENEAQISDQKQD
jgi:hypothetical protein